MVKVYLLKGIDLDDDDDDDDFVVAMDFMRSQVRVVIIIIQ